MGSGHIGQPLLSTGVGGEPAPIQLVWGLVAEGLMGARRLTGPVPGQEGALQPTGVGGEVSYLVNSSSSMRWP